MGHVCEPQWKFYFPNHAEYVTCLDMLSFACEIDFDFILDTHQPSGYHGILCLSEEAFSFMNWHIEAFRPYTITEAMCPGSSLQHNIAFRKQTVGIEFVQRGHINVR